MLLDQNYIIIQKEFLNITKQPQNKKKEQKMKNENEDIDRRCIDAENTLYANPYQSVELKTKYFIRCSAIDSKYSIINKLQRIKKNYQTENQSIGAVSTADSVGPESSEKGPKKYKEKEMERVLTVHNGRCYVYLGYGICSFASLIERYKHILNQQDGQVYNTQYWVTYLKKAILYDQSMGFTKQQIESHIFGNSKQYQEYRKQLFDKQIQINSSINETEREYKRNLLNQIYGMSTLKLDIAKTIHHAHNNASYHNATNLKNNTVGSNAKNKIGEQDRLRQFCDVINSLLDVVPLGTASDRVQSLLWLERKFKGMYGVELGRVHPKYADRNNTKIYIKCRDPQAEPKPPQEGLAPQTSQFRNGIYKWELPISIPQMVYSLQKQYQHTDTYAIAQIKNMHARLVYKMSKQIISQLIQYQQVANQQYPMLHPSNIVYYPNTDCFELSHIPVIVQAFGINYPTNDNKHKVVPHLASSRKWDIQDRVFFDTDMDQQLGYVTNTVQKIIIIIHMLENLTLDYPTTPFSTMLSLKKHLDSSNQPPIPSLLSRLPQIPSSLHSLQHILCIRCHISNISSTKFQQILWLRYKMIRLLYEISVAVLAQLNDIQIINMVGTIAHLLRIVGIGVSLQLSQAIRDQDIKIRQQIRSWIQRLLNKHDKALNSIRLDRIEQITGQSIIINTMNRCQQTYRFIYNSPTPIHHQYSRQIHQILSHMHQHPILSCSLCSTIIKQLPKSTYSPLYPYLKQVYDIGILSVLKIDQNNLYWFQYAVYRKISNYKVEEIGKMYEQVKSKVGAMAQGMWWGY